MITRHRRSKLLSRQYYPSKEKRERDIGIWQALRRQAREQQKQPPVTLPEKENEQ